jgi:hypothetical protein
VEKILQQWRQRPLLEYIVLQQQRPRVVLAHFYVTSMGLRSLLAHDNDLGVHYRNSGIG